MRSRIIKTDKFFGVRGRREREREQELERYLEEDTKRSVVEVLMG